MRRLFFISGLKYLSLDYYSQYEEERCTSDHTTLGDLRSQDIGALYAMAG